MAEQFQSPVLQESASDFLVSVIIPVYNVSRYLPQCLESVIHQTYNNLEIIIIDDGSNDGSAKICDEYARQDSRIQVFHTENRGLASARNLGLDKSNGMFFSFIDGDDWYELHAIQTLLKEAIQTDADIVVARYCREYSNKTISSQYTDKCVRTYRQQDILPAFLAGSFGNVIWNKLYLSGCFETIRFPDGYNYEDVATTWRLIKDLEEKKGTISILSEELFHFRIRNNSITHSSTFNNVNDCWVAYHEKYEAFGDCKEKMLFECMNPIGKMWRSYWGYSKEDQNRARDMVKEMQSFSRANFHRVLFSDFPITTKMICFFSQSAALPVMCVCFYAGQLWDFYRGTRYKMFN